MVGRGGESFFVPVSKILGRAFSIRSMARQCHRPATGGDAMAIADVVNAKTSDPLHVRALVGERDA
jgi:hypothetical protein